MSSLENLVAPGEILLLYFGPILLDLDDGRYTGSILPGALAELVSGRCGGGGSGGGGIRSGSFSSGISDSGIRSSVSVVKGRGSGRSRAGMGTTGSGGAARVQARYDAHLPAFSLWDRKNSCGIM